MSDSIQNAIDYLQETQDKMMEDYKALLRFPSISADPAYASDVSACADWIVGQLEMMGFENCEALATAGHPVVYGEWLKAGADKPHHPRLCALRCAAGGPAAALAFGTL